MLQQQKQHSKITEVSKSKESSHVQQRQNSSGLKNRQQQYAQDDEEDYQELDIDVGQKLKQLQAQPHTDQ